MNRPIKKYFRERIGKILNKAAHYPLDQTTDSKSGISKRRDLSALAGTWSREEEKAFKISFYLN